MTRERGSWVLVVDDEEDIRDIICMILEGHGVPAVGAGDGQEALDLLRASSAPALIILDLMMPRMDGWQLHAALRADPRLADIPVVVLSGDGDVATKAASLDAAGYVRKPVDMDELLRIIDHHRSPSPPGLIG